MFKTQKIKWMSLVFLCLTMLTIFTSCHYNRNKVSVQIQNEQMTIQVDKSKNGFRVVHYNHTFDVKGLDENQHNDLKTRVLDSLEKVSQ